MDLNSVKFHGSVSKIVASQMLAGLERISPEKKNNFYLFSSITGIAGPTEVKKNREDWFGLVSSHMGRELVKIHFFWEQNANQKSSCSTALEGLISASAKKIRE